MAVGGDAVAYAEALTQLAAWQATNAALALGATSGSLLARVRHILRVATPRPRRSLLLASATATVMILTAVGSFHVIARAQSRQFDDPASERRIGPMQVNEILGYELFPGPPRYATDDPRYARAWDVTVAFPDGEMAYKGFSARGLIRYAFDLGDLPIVGGLMARLPVVISRRKHSCDEPARIRAPAGASRRARETVRDLDRTRGASHARICPHASRTRAAGSVRTSDPRPLICYDPERVPQKIERRPSRGHNTPMCGINHGFLETVGSRVTLEELADGLRRIRMDDAEISRLIVNRTGLSGPYDLTLRVGPLPVAYMLTAHPIAAAGLRRMGVLTFPEALQSQLGLRLEPTGCSGRSGGNRCDATLSTPPRPLRAAASRMRGVTLTPIVSSIAASRTSAP